MRLHLIVSGLLCLLFLSGTLSVRAETTKAGDDTLSACSGRQAFSAFANPGFAKRLAKGFNLPNWDADDPARHAKTETLIALYKAGLTHIRLPFYLEALVSGDHDNVAVARYLDNLLDQTLFLNSLGYAVSVDFHAGNAFRNFGTDRFEELTQRLTDIWRLVAKKLSITDPALVAVELLNEPDFELSEWEKHINRLIPTIREILPRHTIIISPSGPQRHETLFDMTVNSDPNTIYAIHYYDPFFFTHQGAEWHPDDDPVRQLEQIPFPVSLDMTEIKKELAFLRKGRSKWVADFLEETIGEEGWGSRDIQQTFKAVANWSRRHKRPVVINEFGVLSHHAPRASRLAWLETVINAAGGNCLSWTHWDYSDGFGFVNPDTGQPDPVILKILTHNKLKTQQ